MQTIIDTTNVQAKQLGHMAEYLRTIKAVLPPEQANLAQMVHSSLIQAQRNIRLFQDNIAKAMTRQEEGAR